MKIIAKLQTNRYTYTHTHIVQAVLPSKRFDFLSIQIHKTLLHSIVLSGRAGDSTIPCCTSVTLQVLSHPQVFDWIITEGVS